MSEDVKVAQKLDIKPRTKDVLGSERVDFSSFLLSDSLLKGLKESGFEKASPIQIKAIPLGTCGLDLIVQAKSGTGKTCVFTVVALNNLVISSSSTQVLVLAPTREIAVQIWEVVNAIGKHMEDLRCYTFIGGLPVIDDKEKLKKCHIAVGTPGRVKQLIEEGALTTENVRLFVLDEADKLMDGGFQEVINWIYSALPMNKQMLALSATYPESLAQHLTAYMRNPTFIRLNSDDPALMGIRQYYKKVAFHPLVQKAFEFKVIELINILSSVAFNQCLVFSNYQARAESLSNTLNAEGWPATHISGAQDQMDRLTAMATLKKYKCRVLVSTDLTSRGIDAEHINLVINLDIPKDHETYLHRIGRAGRFGSFGAGITLASEGKEMAQLIAIEGKCNTKIKPLPDPIPNDLAHSSGYVDIDKLVTTETIALKGNDKNDLTSSNEHETEGTDLKVVTPDKGTTEQEKVTASISSAHCAGDTSTNSHKESKCTAKEEEGSRNHDDEKSGNKRKILKSKRKETVKKEPWSDWLTASEDSIKVESDRRECVRDSVSYDDVDIFSNAKPKKERHKKKQNTTEAARVGTGTRKTEKSSGGSLDVEGNKENIKERANTHRGDNKEDIPSKGTRRLDEESLHKDGLNRVEPTSASVNGDRKVGSQEIGFIKSGKRGAEKQEKEGLKEMSYEQLLASYVHERKKEKEQDGSDEDVTSGHKEALVEAATHSKPVEITKISVDTVQETQINPTEGLYKDVNYHEDRQGHELDETEFEKLRSELKEMLYGKSRYPKPTVAKCYTSIYEEYLSDLNRFKGLADDKKQQELEKMYAESREVKQEAEGSDYAQLCSKVDKILKHMQALQAKDLGMMPDTEKVLVKTEQASSEKNVTVIDKNEISEQNSKGRLFQGVSKEHKVKTESEETFSKTSGQVKSNGVKEEVVKPKKPMFLAMKTGKAQPLHLKTEVNQESSQDTAEADEKSNNKSPSEHSQEINISKLSKSSNLKTGNAPKPHPLLAGNDNPGGISSFGVEYIKKLGALQDNMRNSNQDHMAKPKQHSLEEGEISENEDSEGDIQDYNETCDKKSNQSSKKNQVKNKSGMKRANPYGAWEPVSPKEDKPPESETVAQEEQEGCYYDDSYYGAAYGRTEECDWYYDEQGEEETGYQGEDYTDYLPRDDRDRQYRKHGHYSSQEKDRYCHNERSRQSPDGYFGRPGNDGDYHNVRRDDRFDHDRGSINANRRISHKGSRQEYNDGRNYPPEDYSYPRKNYSADDHFSERGWNYPHSGRESYPGYPLYGSHWNPYHPFKVDEHQHQQTLLQFEQAQSAMWASYMNHMYWKRQVCDQWAARAEQYRQLADVHSQWADYYKAKYKQAKRRDTAQRET